MSYEREPVSEVLPRGFLAGATRAPIRPDVDKLDVGILYSEVPCAAAAVYTSNRVKAAPLLVCQEHLADGRAQAVIANSGCANAATGEQGLADARQMAELAAAKLGVRPSEVLVASTGVIGTQLPMERLRAGVSRIELSVAGGADFARAIMTTDTRPKYAGGHCGRQGEEYSVWAVAKGAGMIHPNMATMLCFIATDAPLDQSYLATCLREAVDASFNMIDVDSDTSTNDTAIVLANGLAGGEPIDAGHPLAGAFRSALTDCCVRLARAIVADAEGGTKVIECTVEGAASLADARRAAREVVRSLAVKTAVYGCDPNWGRILAAVGNSGAAMSEEKAVISISAPESGCVYVYRQGAPLPFDEAQARACLAAPEVHLRVELGLGEGVATAWGSDITEEYVRLNSAYTT
ncbi:MAG TPA: bifunctional glutamate N-acetyltransferase/amino-acid acetyltransferase ArgJ [Dehalococcoidia bacterium]|nr:bifunctional glutamate N-acetyltransferase/amino-acid acetyltransferase ArgJ [Dehalococcoidia bacterium]